MNRSQYIGSPGNARASASPRIFRSTSGGGDDLHSRKNGVFLPNRVSRTDLSTDKVHRSFGSSSRIDPHVYTDTQSRGLTSRLANYYERERIDIKPIVNRLYNKAGDLPIVHLNKNDLTSSSPRQAASLNASRVRIPAPDKSTYISNMRSEILRTGSMVGNTTTLLMPNASDPNPDTSYEVMAPLDALKEISRKRIHCDEVNLSNSVQNLSSSSLSSVDRIKKQRADEHHHPTTTQQTVSKRQRDTTSPTFKQQLSNESQKKRPCTKNNDVLSSLSSSVRLAAARKSFNLPSSAVKPPPTTTTAPKVIDKPLDITSSDISDKSNESLFSETSKRKCPNESSVVQQRPVVVSRLSDNASKPSVAKLTLFNQRYATYNPMMDKKTSDHTDANNHDNDDNDDDDDESAGISFVKPKAGISANNSVISSRRPVESSKLALMLRCLSGDLDDDDDQVDTIVAPISHVKEKKKIEEVAVVTSISLGTSINSGFTLPAVTLGVSTAAETVAKPVAVVSTVDVITTPVTTSMSSTDSSASKPVPSLLPTTIIPKSVAETVVPEPKQPLPSPQNTTFSFGNETTILGSPAKTPSVTSTVNVEATKPIAAPPSFAVGNTATDPTKTFSFGLTSPPPASTAIVIEAPKPAFSFGGSIAVASTAPNTTSAAAKPSFSFGLSSVPSSITSFGVPTFSPAATTTSLTKPTPDLAPLVQRPPLLSTPVPPTTSSPANPTSAAFSFGGVTKPSTGGFSFKQATTAPPPTTDTSKPSASFAFGTPQHSTAAPIFGSSTAILPTPSFGTSSAFGTPSISTTQPSSAFGSSSSNSIFGTSTVPPPTTTTTTAAPLSFGSFNLTSSSSSSSTTAAAAPKPGGFTFNPTPATTPAAATTTKALVTPAAFGGSTSTNSTSFFGATPPAATTTASSTFGAPAPAPIFGASSAAIPSFGSTSSTVFGSTFGAEVIPAFGATSSLGTHQSTFGATNTSAPPTFGSIGSGPFGAATTPTTTPGFGASTTPSFGASTTTPAFGSNTPSFGAAAAFSPFGTPTDKQTPAPPSFGSTTASSAQTSNNFFGGNSASPAAKPFAFGASSANQAAAPPSFGATSSSAFNFGGTSSPAQQQQQPTPSAGSSTPFAYNANTANTTGATSASSSPFAFGSTSAGNAAPSSFGGMASKIPVPTNSVKPFGMSSDPATTATAAAAPPPFAFGAATAAPFAFGSGSGSSNTASASSTAATPGSNGAGGAFNFGGASGGGANLFSATPANGGNTSAVKGRPIRTATRRIFK